MGTVRQQRDALETVTLWEGGLTDLSFSFSFLFVFNFYFCAPGKLIFQIQTTLPHCFMKKHLSLYISILKCLVQDDNDLQRIIVNKHCGKNTFLLLWKSLKCKAKGRIGMLSFCPQTRRKVCPHMSNSSTNRCTPYLQVLEF